MKLDKKGQKLHAKYTSGEQLSSEDLTYLNNWYAEMDRAESKILNVENKLESNEELEKQIEKALKDLVKMTESRRDKM